MRFPHPVAITCMTCGQPTVVAETSIGPERVHCGTWRRQCDIPGSGAEHDERSAVLPASLTALDAPDNQELAA